MWCPPIAEESENVVIMSVISAMMLRFYQAGEVTALSEKALERIKEGIALYKKIRNDINEAIPFYPLGITKFGDKYFCTGYKCSDKTYLCVWHLECEGDEKFIPLENVSQANILYPSLCEYGKVEKADGGLKVTLPQNTALFIEVK
jgi:alpha-galactosidase